MLFFGFYGLLLGCLVFLLGLSHSLGLGFHGHQGGDGSRDQCGHQYVGIGEHRGIQQLLCLFHKHQPAVMQGFRHGQRAYPGSLQYHLGRMQGLHGHDSHKSRFVRSVGTHQSEKDTSHLFIVFHKIGYRIQRFVDDTFGLPADFIEHHADAVLDVADTSGNGLALFLHEVVERTTLVSEVLQGPLHFGEADLTGFHHLAHLALRHPENAGKFTAQRNASPHELIEILCI